MNAGKASSKIALCGILTALSVAAMILAGFMGILTYAAPMIAGASLDAFSSIMVILKGITSITRRMSRK